ncbi:MAG: hypothetical protein HQ581_13155 [Planctomycetes bacterium]|nr:hypothetical protein [Planctomycetota bacterium]
MASYSIARWPVVPTATRACGDFKPPHRIKKSSNDPIDYDAFSTRVQGALRRAAITSWRQLLQLGTDDLLAIPGVGAVGAKEIVEVRGARRSQCNGAAEREFRSD